DAPMDVMITLQPMNICMAAADLVWSRVFKEFRELRVALSEGGTGWIPYFLDRLDRTYDMHHAWTGQEFGGERPSDVFRRHILTCFIADPVGVQLRNDIGIDNICWEMDYPHSDSSWPAAPEELAVRNVTARLALYADGPDIDAYVALFTRDASWEMPAGTRRGHADIRAGSEERRAGGQIGPGTDTRHSVTTTAVTVDGDHAV